MNRSDLKEIIRKIVIEDKVKNKLKTIIKECIKEVLDDNLDKTLKKSGSPTKLSTTFFVNKVDLNRGSRDPDAEREIVFQVVKVTSDSGGDDYKEIVVDEYHDEDKANVEVDRLNKKLKADSHLVQPIKEIRRETFYKKVSGTVNVDGEDYDYSADVEYIVVTTREPHGEYYSDLDPSAISFDVTEVTPEPPDEKTNKKIDDAIHDDIQENL